MSIGPILSASAFQSLVATDPEPEAFGPGTENEALCIELDGLDRERTVGQWIQSVACPIIGIGDGPASEAFDVVVPARRDAEALLHNIRQWPLAAMVMVQHLRAPVPADTTIALQRESFAFSTLQSGPEFAAWRAARSMLAEEREDHAPPVLLSRDGEKLEVILNRPARQNAIDAEMRDALFEAFQLAMIDRSVERVYLSANGRCFSVGGDVREFGQAPSGAHGHLVRSVRLPALCMPGIADRLFVSIDGAAIGAGIEMASFAGRIEATSRSWFQLPELKYGLMPGAGGTVGITRRIGRQRTAFMALSMRRISARLALDWGLIDAIVDS